LRVFFGPFSNFIVLNLIVIFSAPIRRCFFSVWQITCLTSSLQYSFFLSNRDSVKCEFFYCVSVNLYNLANYFCYWWNQHLSMGGLNLPRLICRLRAKLRVIIYGKIDRDLSFFPSPTLLFPFFLFHSLCSRKIYVKTILLENT
jgi:hypothetical protein